jgi:hypothetical protein
VHFNVLSSIMVYLIVLYTLMMRLDSASPRNLELLLLARAQAVLLGWVWPPVPRAQW